MNNNMKTEGKTFGYVRVSSSDQNEDRQIIAMREAGVPLENIYEEKQSGKDFNRPVYKKLISKMKAGDVLYVMSIDRLGRNYEEILEQWRMITKEKDADIVVIDMPILDTRCGKDLLGTLISDLVLALLSYAAENERSNIRKRQAEGIAAARINGVHLGRKPDPLPENFGEVYIKWINKEITINKAAHECGMAQTTFYDKARKYKTKK